MTHPASEGTVPKTKQYHHDGTRWHFIFPQTPKRKGRCRVIYCKRLARVRVRANLRVEQDSICITCASRLYRMNNPAREAYRQIRDRAERRGQIFNITFAEFLAEIEGTEYLARRGRGPDELHLDRAKVHLGYVPGNLKVITAAENLRKQREVDYPKIEEPF
jgi:hypothetical protein